MLTMLQVQQSPIEIAYIKANKSDENKTYPNFNSKGFSNLLMVSLVINAYTSLTAAKN